MNVKHATMGLMLAAFLVGCAKESASFKIDGEASERALVIKRLQNNFWSQEFDRALIVYNYPDCVRQYPLPVDAGGNSVIEVYRLSPARVALRDQVDQVTIDVPSCAGALKPIKEAGPATGTLLGRFEHQQGAYRFVPAPAAAGSTPATAPATTAPGNGS